MRTTLPAIIFLIVCPFLAAQQTLNNDSVIQMEKGGLSDGVIISAINASPGAYDTTAGGLIALKKGGVTDKVIETIVAKSATPGAAPAASSVVSPTHAPGLPPSITGVGVYYMDSGGAWHSMNTEAVTFKSGGGFKHIATAGLVKGDLNGQINGSRSALVLKIPAKFIIETPEGTQAGAYQLLRLHASGNNRQFRSATGGFQKVDSNSTNDDVQFMTKQIAKNAYEIDLNTGIGNGEFGFFPPQDTPPDKSTPSSSKIYTFALMP